MMIRIPESLAGRPMPEWIDELLHDYDVEAKSLADTYNDIRGRGRALVALDRARKNGWQEEFFRRFQAGCPTLFDFAFGVGCLGDLNPKPSIDDDLIICTFGKYDNPDMIFFVRKKT